MRFLKDGLLEAKKTADPKDAFILQELMAFLESNDSKSAGLLIDYQCDTYSRELCLDLIDPIAWEGLGFKPLNMEKSLKTFNQKYEMEYAHA